MNKIVIAALVTLIACKGRSKKVDDDQVRTLPVPTKLPPAPTGSAQNAGNDHAAEIDNEYATLIAMYNAPAGATPCDSLYNAVLAEQAKAKELQRDSVFTFVAPKDTFMKLCTALPTTEQQCLVPSYQSHHGRDCEAVNMTNEKFEPMFKLRGDLEPPKEAGQAAAQ